MKKQIKHYIARHHGDPDSMEPLMDLFEDLVCDELKHNHPELYHEFMEEFNELMNEITEEDIINAVGMLMKKDGTRGPKWAREETDSLIHQFNIREKAGKKFEDIDFWFAMNYAFANHSAPNKTISAYIDLALDEMLDKNVCFKKKIRILNEAHEKEILHS
jgi:hypothetical protein